MKAEIVSIGTELLIGQIVNTNATYLAQQLADYGIDLQHVITVGDNPQRIQQALQDAWNRSDLVICTGGLGPTPDDLTAEQIAEFLKLPMELYPEALEHIRRRFELRGRTMSQSDPKQAYFPKGAKLIPDPPGTATSFYVNQDGKTILAFPGPPKELESAWKTWAKLVLENHQEGAIVSHLLKFIGMPEAVVAERVSDLLNGTNPTVAPYVGNWEVHLRVTAKAKTRDEAEVLLAPVIAEIKKRLAKHYFGQDDETLPQVVGQLLLKRGHTLATAESCTGGLIASRLTDISGSSRYFFAGFIPYATEKKTAILGIPADLIETHGVVSAKVAEALANHARDKAETNWGLGITGYAGASEGIPPEAVGTVFIGVATPDKTYTEEFHFGGMTRESVKWAASQSALAMLWHHLSQA